MADKDNKEKGKLDPEKDWNYALKGHLKRFAGQDKQSDVSIIISALLFIAIVILFIFL